nr:L,D-transpeptidase [Chloroflexia bacterium]
VGELLVERFGLDTAPVPQGDIPAYDEALFIQPVAVPEAAAAPPPVDGAAKSVVISLNQQALWVYEGGEIIRSTYVSTGTEKFKTPPGLFSINTKVEMQDMEGVIGGESYDVEKVPDVMYFTNRGHAIHGAYWHDNFGNPMSHGCVNLPLEFAEWLYAWAPVGTPVLIVA